MSGLRNVTRAIAALVIATPLIAQSARTVSDTTVRGAPAASSLVMPPATIIERVPSAGPSAPSWKTAIAATPASASAAAAASPIESGSTAENKVLMIAGGAGIVAGAIIGGHAGTVLMIGGSLVGLVGLWHYLK